MLAPERTYSNYACSWDGLLSDYAAGKDYLNYWDYAAGKD